MKLASYSTAIAVFAASMAFAESLPAPTGDVLLTLSGEMDKQTSDGVVQLDMSLLQSLPVRQFTTATIWQDGPVEFTGVSLRDLLDHTGATGTAIEAVALNDYSVEIPVDSITEDAPIVAYHMDGKEMSPRDKGPLWIVYPYDAAPEYRTEVVYSRSIWQLDRIVSVK